MIKKAKEHWFLFSELVKRDFKKKYKRTYLGMFWSVLSPLITLLVMHIIFSKFFGGGIENYTIYLFCGNIIFTFFSDAASGGMTSIMSNSEVFSKINVPKYLFVLSRNVCSLINFALTFAIFFVFCIINGVAITPYFLTLIFPIICLIAFNIGVGLILSALFVFFKDVQYLWGIFNMLLTYVSAIFYSIETFSATARGLFYLNPVYVYISYFRTAVLGAAFPAWWLHLLALGYAALFFAVGVLVYKKCNRKFLYYV